MNCCFMMFFDNFGVELNSLPHFVKILNALKRIYPKGWYFFVFFPSVSYPETFSVSAKDIS